MNRRMRRARARRCPQSQPSLPYEGELQGPGIDDVYAAAAAHRRNGELATAQSLCRTILDREPRHVRTLVLLGDLVQQDGRNKLALKLLGQALTLDCTDAAAHDNIAMAHQALGRRDLAIQHFAQAMALGLQGAENLIKQSAAIAAPLKRLAEAWPRHLRLGELLGAQGAAPFAAEAMLLALLQSTVLCDLDLERLLTAVRRGLLETAAERDADTPDADALEFFGALAQQCFLNDYVFAFGDIERAQLQHVRSRLVQQLAAGSNIAPLDLVVVATYLPLYKLPLAAALLRASWPDSIDRLLRQQIREPLEEEADRRSLQALTTIDDSVSMQVRNQYEENPYPRWATVPLIKPSTVVNFVQDELGVTPKSWSETDESVDILVAGCGTGSHSIDTARRFPRSQVLAVDISRSSLAYACRKTRELGLGNVTHAQADILKLAALGRRFHVIESVGVLHHLSDPEAGWRVLLSLLRPNGLMFIGLYSALARQPLDAARALIAERGYRATPDDIRAFRQEAILRGSVPPSRDFASTAGCRDLLFNVMEHQFTLPQIEEFLDANALTFLGFEQLPPGTMDGFREQFPETGAFRDLRCWHSYEETNPRAFGSMYVFWAQKCGAD
jgi:2-polyprenyl-3-methyl-5-hydroxy-6-metoxy-1,4-benzoquinol methylase